MKGFFFSVIALLLAAVGAVDPGLKFRVSHEALNYGAQEAMNVASVLLLDQDIPAFSGEAGLNLGTIKYNLDQLRIIRFEQGTADVHLDDDNAVLDVSGIGLSLKGKWKYNYKLGFIHISDSGSFDLEASGADLKLGVVLGMGNGGKLVLSTTQCDGRINNLDVTFQGGASWLYNIFRSLIAKSIKGVLNDMLCEGIETAVEDHLSPVLEDFVLEFPIADVGTLDFHFTEAPAFNMETVETYHKGEFFWAGDRTEVPFPPAPLTEPDQELRMITVWMSDYVINSLFYVLHKHDVTKFIFGAGDLPSDHSGLLNMTCPGSACFGSILPAAIAAQFPDSTVSIEGWTLAQPTLKVDAKGVHAMAELRLDFTAVKPNGETFMLFSTSSKFDASMIGEMDGSKLKFKIKNISPEVTLLESNVDGITGSLLTIIFRVGTNGVLKPMIDDIGEQGIPIPDFDLIEYVNPYLMLKDNTIIMELDVAYAPKYADRLLQFGRARPHLFLN
ncbi:hypothetical protein CAPTEDRAFT_228469 [Capitella teleta]|uniref:Lipid-binding serum glycoprotein C-terminal domain-containing protein n=1 Tax=Capitella teleta TaxID=283909 RepID=R7V5K2_CAPTE|nr:hypothetical protein CAPTEDRAFT_228469 [Capitella teleta]|eukprot:ELU11065.1 hypothetical protein CAPTEDRAFT_228469 [Capitella teleta]